MSMSLPDRIMFSKTTENVLGWVVIVLMAIAAFMFVGGMALFVISRLFSKAEETIILETSEWACVDIRNVEHQVLVGKVMQTRVDPMCFSYVRKVNR